MIYLFDKDEKLIKIVRKSAVKTALQKYALTTERYVSDRLTVELKGLNADELEQVEYMAIQTMEDAHTFHYFYVAQKFSDELTTLIGVQSGIEELRKSPVFDKRPKNALARDVITDLLAGTNWQARFVGETTPHSTNFYYTSIFDALKKVCDVWDLEMQFFVEMNGNRIGARYIDFKQRIGEAVGKRVVYGHNALQILQEVERTNIFTALVGRGKGEETGDGYGRKITFADVVWSRTQGKPVDKPKGQKYLEMPLMTRQYGIKNSDGTMRPKIGFVDFSEEENPEVLIERTYRALIDAARPQLTLKTSSVYLRNVKVGDTIRVVRHDKKLDYDTRIFEITFNRLNNKSSDIKLGDRIGESNEAKVQTIADKAVEQFVNNEFSNFVQNLPDYLPSADDFNNNWYGTEDPTVKYPGKVLINDIWYKPDPEHEGHKIMLRWTGEVWEEILRTYESEALRDRIAEEIAQVEQSMQSQADEHDRQVADILSKTQSVEALANQAKSDAANAIARANQVKTEAIADTRAQVATVSQALNSAKSELQTAIASADQKARDSQASATALRNDLNLQASKILEQARAQTALTNRVSTVETLADGTKTTVAELSKTLSKATGDITSVTSRTKTVEDTLSQTRTQYEALSQTVNAQTGQIESINRKTADLQSGIDGVTERFENLRVGGENLLSGTDEYTEILNSDQRNAEFLRTPYDLAPIFDKYGLIKYTLSFDLKAPKSGQIAVYQQNGSGSKYSGLWKPLTVTTGWQRFHVTFTPTEGTSTLTNSYLAFYGTYGTGVKPIVRRVKLEKGNVATDWSPSTEDLRHEIATYKRTAEESSAELSRQIQLADGKAVDAKTYAQQTAAAIHTRLESLETYKDGENTRASQYFTASRDETARQVSALRTAVTNDYVAKSTFEENARGVAQRFESLYVGGTNLLRGTDEHAEIFNSAQSGAEFLKTPYDLAPIFDKYGLIEYTLSFDLRATKAGTVRVCQQNGSGSKYNGLNFYVQATTEWKRFEVTFIPTAGMMNLVNSYLSFYGTYGTGVKPIVRRLKLEKGNIATDWSPSPEDQQSYADTKIAEYKNTVDGRFTTLQSETIPQAILTSKQIKDTRNDNQNPQWYWSNYPKQTVEEFKHSTVIGLSGESTYAVLTTNVQWGDSSGGKIKQTAKTDRATFERYGTGTSWEPWVKIANTGDLANYTTKTEFQTVKETTGLYERIIGSTESGVKDKIARMVMADSLFQTEVKDAISGTATQVSQLAGSWAVKNLTSSGKVLNQLNLNKDGSVKIDGSLVQITGRTYIKDGIISAAKIGDLSAGKITSGYLAAARIAANSIDGSKLVFDQAFVNKMTANEALFKQLFAKNAFITAVQAVSISASQITGGLMKATNGAMEINLNAGQMLYYTDNAALKRVLSGYPTQFVKFATGTVTGKGNAGVTVIGSNRWNSESSNDGGFVGIRAWNGANIDQIDVVGDTVRLASSAFKAADGWTINTLPGKLDIDAFNADHRASSKIKVGDLWLWKNATTYSSMRDTINLIIDNLQLLHNNKSTERGYSYTLPAKV
ncbi:TPA: phage tail spike protein [Streptococcus suis]